MSRKASERALELERKILEIQRDTSRKVDEQRAVIDELLRQYVAEIPDEEENTKIRHLREIVRRTGITTDLAPLSSSEESPLGTAPTILAMPAPITQPPVTRPSPAELEASRAEPSWGMPGLAIPDAVTSRPIVLVIDDDKDLVDTLKEVLTEEGYRVETAQDGAEGFWALWASPRVDLVLLDLTMPRHSAVDFFRAFDRTEMLGIVPVVLISGAPPPQHALDHGVVYLRKPLDLPRLLETVRANIERSHRARGRNPSG